MSNNFGPTIPDDFIGELITCKYEDMMGQIKNIPFQKYDPVFVKKDGETFVVNKPVARNIEELQSRHALDNDGWQPSKSLKIGDTFSWRGSEGESIVTEDVTASKQEIQSIRERVTSEWEEWIHNYIPDSPFGLAPIARRIR